MNENPHLRPSPRTTARRLTAGAAALGLAATGGYVVLAARYVGRDRAEARRDALALMERLGVADRRDHYPAQLSGGEQQRVAFCRAVLNGPPLILADEPTGSLDDRHARVILTELSALVRERAASVILVTHRLEAAREADRTLRLDAGRLATA